MPKFMKISSALARAVEDERAPATMRVKALEPIQRPTLNMLRRLLVRSKSNPVKRPSKLLALAALKYADAKRAQALRVARKKQGISSSSASNPLGI